MTCIIQTLCFIPESSDYNILKFVYDTGFRLNSIWAQVAFATCWIKLISQFKVFGKWENLDLFLFISFFSTWILIEKFNTSAAEFNISLS